MKNNHARIHAMTSVAALLFAAGVAMARAEEVDHSKMDHSKMDHGAAAPVQWADPGKAQAPAATEAKPAEAPKADSGHDHAGHQGMDKGAGGHAGMDHGKGGGMGGMMNHMICGFAEHLEGRLGYLKAELNLTDAQTGAWNSFAEAWRGAAQKAQQKCAASDGHTMDPAQPAVMHKLTMMEHHMTDHLDVIRAQKSAIESLFSALSDTQKKTASEVFANIMKVGSMGMGGGGMGGMDHGGGGMGGMMGGMKH